MVTFCIATELVVYSRVYCKEGAGAKREEVGEGEREVFGVVR